MDVFGGVIDASAGPKPFTGFQISQYPSAEKTVLVPLEERVAAPGTFKRGKEPLTLVVSMHTEKRQTFDCSLSFARE